jgi:hypothetical protein
MKRSSISTWIYLLLVFASGAALGVFSDHLYTTKTVLAKTVSTKTDPNEYRRKYIDEMKTRLKLDAGQVTSLTAILDDARSRMRDLHEKYRPEMISIHNAQVEKVNEILSDSQKALYQKMLQEREAKRRSEQK